MPLLELIGTPVSVLGDVEQATTFKLVSNLIGMTIATLEVFLLAAQRGWGAEDVAAVYRLFSGDASTV